MEHPRIAVVGAGPCGLGVGVAARNSGVDCVLFDRSCVVSAITRYPTHMTFFSTAERLELGDVPFTTPNDKPGRREAIRYYQRIVRHFDLQVRQYTEVGRVERLPQGFRLHLRSRDGVLSTYDADAVVVATGYLDTPVLMNVPGEELPNVTHYYKEGSCYFDQRCIVVGAGNSSVDAALDLFRWGADVTLVHFDEAIDPGVKPWISPEILSRINSGDIKVRWRTRVVEIRPTSVILRDEISGTEEEVRNDWVFAMTGYRPDPGLLTALGVDIDPATGIPSHELSSMQTNQTGVYIAGVVAAGYNANKIFIENGREHGPRILDHLLGR